MKTIEKTEDEKYQEWVFENGEFLRRFIKDYFYAWMIQYMNTMDHESWMKANKKHLYVEMENIAQDIIFNAMKYNNKYRGYDWINNNSYKYNGI